MRSPLAAAGRMPGAFRRAYLASFLAQEQRRQAHFGFTPSSNRPGAPGQAVNPQIWVDGLPESATPDSDQIPQRSEMTRWASS